MNSRLIFLALAIVAILFGLYWLPRDKGVLPDSTESPAISAELTPPSDRETGDSLGPSPVFRPTPPSDQSAIQPTDTRLDAAVLEKWFTEEGYTQEDIDEARALLREQGFPEDSLNDAGLIRRHLLPRVVTSVQVSEINVPAQAPANAPISFTLKGAVPTPEFNFVRFDIVRQGEIVRIRALGHSPAFDETLAVPSRMLPVELTGELPPLPPGNYRILIPELGADGLVNLEVK